MNPEYEKQRKELIHQLQEWQKRTNDALGTPANARKLFDMIQSANLDRDKELPYKDFMNQSFQ